MNKTNILVRKAEQTTKTKSEKQKEPSRKRQRKIRYLQAEKGDEMVTKRMCFCALSALRIVCIYDTQ